jgi:dimeric dUTPase (all-alpha-NTP-PPase superfamily)
MSELEKRIKCRKYWEKNYSLKMKYSLYSALIFFMISSPQMYKLTSKVIPSANYGCPTPLGLVTHTFVFMLALFGFMNLPKDI